MPTNHLISERNTRLPKKNMVVDAAIANTAVNIAICAVTQRITNGFEYADLQSIILKGPFTCYWLYGDLSSRQSTDVDVLVKPCDMPQARSILTRLGYRPIDSIGVSAEPRHAVTWVHSESPIAIDLHSTIVGARADVELVWGVLSSTAERIQVGAMTVDVPAADIRLAYLTLHAAQHGARGRHALEDLKRALDVFSPSDWADASRVAFELDGIDAFTAGLLMVARGREVIENLGLPLGPRGVDTQLRLQTAPDLSLGLQRLTELDRWSARVEFTRVKLLPPPAFMKAWWPIARRGRFGLAGAYIARLAWLAFKTPRAAVAVLQARRAVRRIK